MLVKIKLLDIKWETEKAALCEIRGCASKWIPNRYLTITKQGTALVPLWFAQKAEIPFKAFTHIPDKIEPKYNQKAINELEYKAKKSV